MIWHYLCTVAVQRPHACGTGRSPSSCEFDGALHLERPIPGIPMDSVPGLTPMPGVWVDDVMQGGVRQMSGKWSRPLGASLWVQVVWLMMRREPEAGIGPAETLQLCKPMCTSWSACSALGGATRVSSLGGNTPFSLENACVAPNQ
jgi:hypothetical protein|mmetsp:Transcript_15718/g.27675  ORF Transcript_15718/g.27675 Transcript_15718/m.27675 type:complete len:146 (+) Transcript_15718:810-1247(+)|eukprot:CAMPEP_0174286302 /NCGR_PEP_ID=MMETSP0809-20121228/11307_1 /TAXON_ID=73025 ORGANISM="Eutreptiella gymnastica-like, Strain CCMP1594" /NCGR_SAMPLE_ID=MMETSP0809 /ASSEMBLY_ACC=CAM_ASM_000658 /LENGTH=145 /DNA_ID=CAMNT_0015382319 /DNA_START=661 /DNA_END=1098 /DNA_ORIENTATION=-